MLGKSIRLERILNRDDGRTVIVPMDHGAGMGPIDGLKNMKDAANAAAEGGADCVCGHMGLALHGHRGAGRDLGLMLHFSISTELNPVDGNAKVLVNSVENALKMGADAVSLHLNLGSLTEAEQLRDFGQVSQKCLEWGVPLLAMVYPRGPEVPVPATLEQVKIAARVAAELGADIVKVPYTGSIESFKEVVDGALGIPVVIAGGSPQEDLVALEMVEGAITAGGAGIAMGRSAFQHALPAKFIAATSAIVHGGKTAKEALSEHLS